MPNSYLHNQACYNSNYTQPVFTYPQKPKKSANICSTLGFIFGLLALFGYLFIYVNTILSIKGYTSDGGAYSIFSLFVTICLTPFFNIRSSCFTDAWNRIYMFGSKPFAN